MEFIIETHAKNILKSNNLNELDEFTYSFGYCQGDHFTAYGTISDKENIAAIFNMAAEDDKDLLTFQNIDVEDVSVAISDPRHSASISLESHYWQLQDDEEFSAIERMKFAKADEMIGEMETWILQKVRSLQDQIYTECRKLLEAGNPLWWTDSNDTMNLYGEHVCYHDDHTIHLKNGESLIIRLVELEFRHSTISNYDMEWITEKLIPNMLEEKWVSARVYLYHMDEDGEEIENYYLDELVMNKDYRKSQELSLHVFHYDFSHLVFPEDIRLEMLEDVYFDSIRNKTIHEALEAVAA